MIQPEASGGDNPSQRVLTVSLGDRSYPVRIGRDLIRDIVNYVPFSMKDKNIFILTDENARPYADQIRHVLQKTAGAMAIHVFPVPPGEESKSFLWYEKVLHWMLDSGVTRQSVLFAVGGGVVGDLAGFAAATVLRGIHLVQIPTTLLAQVDSGVGGKTAIDMPQGKNLVGAFYQPSAVLCDLNTLETLNVRQRLAGYAEIIKYGVINDPEFFVWLERDGKAVCDLEEHALAHAIETACRKKAEIVAQDEREADVRALLNFGHTFGHALEAAVGYSSKLLHGEAVAVGMMMALRLSERMGHCNDEPAARLGDHLREIGLPTSIRDLKGIIPEDPAALVRLMYADKKAEAGGLTFILVRRIGEAFVARRVPEEEVLAVVKGSMHGG
jgi:3-dehydroquinate synthase